MENYQDLVDEFNRRNPDLLVELQGIPGSYYDKLLVMFAGRTAPDVMWMGKGMAQFASRNAFLDVEDEFRIPPGHYYESVLDCYRFNGRLMGFPLGPILPSLSTTWTCSSRPACRLPLRIGPWRTSGRRPGS